MDKRTGTDRIERENENELGNKLASAMVEQASPGIFTGGKEITETQNTQDPATGMRIYTFRFNDGSAMRITGHFDIDFLQPGMLPQEADIEGEATEEQPAIEKGQ